MNLGSENGPLTPSLSPKGEREKTSRNLHWVQGFNARFYRGNLSSLPSSLLPNNRTECATVAYS
jgi:hypothetical protein